MTRRVFLAVPVIGAAAVPDTPRNRLVGAANQFNSQYAAWAAKMNAKVGTLDVGAVEAFQPLPGLWRKVEQAFTGWVRGL